jgi:hypothetical protein
MIANPDSSALDQWRQMLDSRRRFRVQRRPRAALGYLANGPVIQDLIEIEKLTIVLLYDEPADRERVALRLAGYAATRVPWGVRFGGPEQCRFFKDLLLQPVPQARGYRLDLASMELLQLGLGLARELDRHARYRQRHVREQIRLPKLWAGFRAADATGITGDGPELADYACHTGRQSDELMEHLRRSYFGLTLYPLAWVSHHWQQAVAIFADLERFPRRQVFSLQQLPGNLIGCQGAAEFDFLQSRFRRQRRQQEADRSVPVAG